MKSVVFAQLARTFIGLSLAYYATTSALPQHALTALLPHEHRTLQQDLRELRSMVQEFQAHPSLDEHLEQH